MFGQARRFKNHVVFNLRCRSAEVIPKSLEIKSPVNTVRGRAIARKASRGFLKERIRTTVWTKKQLEDEKSGG